MHRRDGDLHDTHGKRLVDETTNQTTYQFGYLYMADTLCYWNRELMQVRSILGDSRTHAAGVRLLSRTTVSTCAVPGIRSNGSTTSGVVAVRASATRSRPSDSGPQLT